MPRPQFPTRGQGPGRGLLDAAIGTSEIADAAVISPKVASGAIGPTGLASSAVTTIKINDAAVISPKFGTGAIGPTALASSAVTTVKINDAAVVGPKLGADSAGLTAVADPIRRRTMTVHVGATVTGATNWPILRGGAEAPQVTGCYVSTGAAMYHAAGEADTWIFQLRNVTRGLNLVKNNASLSGVTLASTAWKSLPINNGNSTLTAGDSLQFQLTESGTAQTLDQLMVMLEWQPTVNT